MNRKLFETHLIVCTFGGVIIFIHLQQDCNVQFDRAVRGTAYKHLYCVRLLPGAILSRRMLWKAQYVSAVTVS